LRIRRNSPIHFNIYGVTYCYLTFQILKLLYFGFIFSTFSRTFGSSSSFSTAAAKASEAKKDEEDGEEEESDEPPKVEVTPVEEKDSIYSVRFAPLALSISTVVYVALHIEQCIIRQFRVC